MKRVFYTLRNIHELPQVATLSPERRFALEVVGQVLPFRVNRYVVDHLIDWSRVPDDPIYQLTFMHPGMLRPDHFARVADLLRRGAPRAEVARAVADIRRQLNPHPAGQRSLNVPTLDGEPVAGLQHKYRETCLLFPAAGQTCHAYCTYCFRWPQFVGAPELRFATDASGRHLRYIAAHTEISDVLVTGGDPLVMSTARLARVIEPLLEPRFAHVRVIRVGTKSVAYWPHRFVTDDDADDLLRLFERVVAAGKHLALMAHYNHPFELSTPVARRAVARVRATGAEIRSQSPVIRHVNDDPDVWAALWREQVRLGCVPYYMFVARDTGAQHYFSVPLVRCWEIYREAQMQVSGLARTARGPSMSCLPGKIVVDGVARVAGERVLALSFVQARDPAWVRRPFFARYDPEAVWIDDLRPAFGEARFFFEEARGGVAAERLRRPAAGAGGGGGSARRAPARGGLLAGPRR